MIPKSIVSTGGNAAIAATLYLGEATVKTHLQAIFRKLEVNTRTQAVMAAIHLGLHAPGSLLLPTD